MTSDLIDITPPGGWYFDVIGGLTIPMGRHNRYSSPKLVSERFSFGGSTFYHDVRQLLQKNKNDFVHVREHAAIQRQLIVGYKTAHYRFKRDAARICETAKQLGRSPLIGFAHWYDEAALDMLSTMRYVQEITDGKALVFVGGCRLYHPNALLDYDLFRAGADILNRGGGHDLAQMIAGLTYNDKFYRDSDSLLVADIPSSTSYFSYHTRDNQNVRGKPSPSVPMPVLSENISKTGNGILYVLLPGSGCSNNCGFCAIPMKTRCNRFDQAIRDEISENARLTKIAMCTLKDYSGKGAHIFFNNENPLQVPYNFIDYVDNLKRNRTWPNVLSVTCFGNSFAFLSKEAIQEYIDYIELCFNGNDLTRLALDFSVDSLTSVNDGDFIKRRLENKLLSAEEYESIRINLLAFFSEVTKSPWADRVDIRINQIVNPACDAELYIPKLQFIDETYKELGRSSVIWELYVLTPSHGTEIARNYSGHFMPPSFFEHVATNNSMVIAADISQTLSCWGNQFLNGDLLDVYAIYKTLDPQPYSSNSYLTKDGVFERLLRRCSEASSSTGGGNNRLSNTNLTVETLDRFLDVFIELAENADPVKLPFAKRLYSICEWINLRETYLTSTNPVYDKNPMCHLLIKYTGEIQKSLMKVMPELRDFHGRPKRKCVLPARVNAVKL